MLTENFIASTLAPEKPNSSVIKAVGIHHYNFKPIPGAKSSFKNSSTHPNCLAVSTSHIFAAQAEKAVIHVYSREHKNQEAIVPFPEKIRSVALGGNADNGWGLLVLGMEGGSVILWELCTGRQVSTPQAHLQPTTRLAVDRTCNFLLSGSPDSNIHLWSIPSLLSFSASLNTITDPSQPLPYSPIRTLSNHRAAINALAFGHSFSTANIAVSASEDKTCIVWDYLTSTPLHTFLLATPALCLTLDPGDRALYAGHEDGSVQFIDFYPPTTTLTHPLHDPTLQATPTQPPPADRWHSRSTTPSAILCLSLSYDGTTLLSGHRSGTIQTWDVTKGRFDRTLTDLVSPVTNLKMLDLAGLQVHSDPLVKIHHVIKPRYESSLGSSAFSISTGIPANYTFTAQFVSPLSLPSWSSSSPPSLFQASLQSPTFPPSLLDPSIASLSLLSSTQQDPSSDSSPALQAQNAHLLEQLNAALHTQRAAVKQILALDRERRQKAEEERVKRERKRRRRERRGLAEKRRRETIMREQAGSETRRVEKEDGNEEKEDEEKDELSSSTAEFTDSE